jgi:hypothetical protein
MSQKCPSVLVVKVIGFEFLGRLATKLLNCSVVVLSVVTMTIGVGVAVIVQTELDLVVVVDDADVGLEPPVVAGGVPPGSSSASSAKRAEIAPT